MVNELWQRLERLPYGKTIFSRLLARKVPYSGSIRAEVLELAPGHSRVRMRDRRELRNHLHSIHAVALMNLAELTTGIALNVGLPKNARAILRGFQVEFVTKARGTLIGEADFDPPQGNEKRDYEIVGTVRDPQGTVVCRAKALWRIGPKPG